MAEELVPQGLPHGERQNQEDAMKQAGLRLDLPQGNPQAQAAQAAPAGPQRGTPSADILQRRKPLQPFQVPAAEQLDTRAPLRELAATTPNLFVSSLLQRFLEQSND